MSVSEPLQPGLIFFEKNNQVSNQMMLEEAASNRRINHLPQPLLAKCTPYTTSDFMTEVRTACTSDRFIATQLKISKVLLLGNVAVGKSCLVNRWISLPRLHSKFQTYSIPKSPSSSCLVISMLLTMNSTTDFGGVHRFCHNTFDNNYKATIGVDFEVERFDILQVPFNLQMSVSHSIYLIHISINQMDFVEQRILNMM